MDKTQTQSTTRKQPSQVAANYISLDAVFILHSMEKT